MLFFNFSLFPFSKFQIIVKKLIVNFEGFYELLHVTNIFDLHIFDNETIAITKAVLAIVKEGLFKIL